MIAPTDARLERIQELHIQRSAVERELEQLQAIDIGDLTKDLNRRAKTKPVSLIPRRFRCIPMDLREFKGLRSHKQQAVFLHLVANVVEEDTAYRHGNQWVLCPRGCVLISVRGLALEARVGKESVCRCLKLLESQGTISQFVVGSKKIKGLARTAEGSPRIGTTAGTLTGTSPGGCLTVVRVNNDAYFLDPWSLFPKRSGTRPGTPSGTRPGTPVGKN